jgi:F0F1-type ATP synthase epsilon subunit
LGTGDIRILDEKGEKKDHFAIKKGFIEVLKNEVSLLVQGIK